MVNKRVVPHEAGYLNWLKSSQLQRALFFCSWTYEAEYYGDYAISTSDGHDEDWTFYWSKEDCDKDFKILMEYEDDIHVYEYSKQYGYEVIDSFWDGEL